MKKVETKVGDELAVDFTKNEKGGKPVCRVNGIIGFIANETDGTILPGSTWMVKVVAVNEKTVVVYPLIKVRSAKDNYELMEAKLRTLIPEKKARNKVKKGYQYLSHNELKAYRASNT